MNALQTLATLSLIGCCCHLRAELIFSNMGANDTNFFPGAGHGVRVTDSTYQAYAMGFRVGASPYVFTGLRLPLLNLSGIDNLIVSLRQDAAMGPGNVVEILSKDSPYFLTGRRQFRLPHCYRRHFLCWLPTRCIG